MNMIRILFQGDSITDAFRAREDEKNLGCGYPNLVAAELGFENPGEYEFLNKGVSGDRIVDLQSRIKKDMINLKPDVISILIGINDVWHEIEEHNGVSTAKYELLYDMLIKEIKNELENAKLMIIEPFVLQGTATSGKWESFKKGQMEKAEAAKGVAYRNGVPFVPLQEKFNAVSKLAPDGFWLADGVHPTPAGHELIKREWIKAFKKL